MLVLVEHLLVLLVMPLRYWELSLAVQQITHPFAVLLVLVENNLMEIHLLAWKEQVAVLLQLQHQAQSF
jgi:hypothetical protein